MERIEVAKLACLYGGSKILEIREDPKRLQSSLKPDETLVTVADKMSEKAMKQIIHTFYPRDEILSEEQDRHLIPAEDYWCLDPLDGTVVFEYSGKEFATMCAWIQKGYPLLGAMYFPMFNIMVSAERGKGCFINGKRHSTMYQKTLREATVIIDTARTATLEMAEKIEVPLKRFCAFNENHPAAYSILKLLRGDVGVYFASNLKLWDFAVARVALLEAGGTMMDRRKEFPGWPMHTVVLPPVFCFVSERIAQETFSLLHL